MLISFFYESSKSNLSPFNDIRIQHLKHEFLSFKQVFTVETLIGKIK